MTYKEIYDVAMPPKKRAKEKFNFWVALVVRPLSIIFTIPLLKTSIKPTTITKWSILASFIGFFLLILSNDLMIKIVGWFFYFIWAILDGVDGNVARCKDQCSNIGELWDATGGYLTMILIYFSAGIIAYNDINIYDFCGIHNYIILGGATSLFSIFPRLVLQKKKSQNVNSDVVNKLTDKSHFGLKQILVMNLVSASGFLQVVFLLSLITHVMNFFILIYFLINLAMMIISLKSLLKE